MKHLKEPHCSKSCFAPLISLVARLTAKALATASAAGVALRAALTFLTAGQVATPRQVPLAHENLRALQLEPGVALVCDHRAVYELGVGGALPAVADLRELGTCVIAGDLCGGDSHMRGREEATVERWHQKCS